MKHSEFVHLHLHSQYSLLDGAIQFGPLFKKAQELKMPAIAITDHGSMFGAVDFYHAALKSGVKPIIGCEAYVAQGSRFDRGQNTANSKSSRANHLVLLVQNAKGYRNLCKLVSQGYTEGYYYKPRIDKELLAEHSEGLIALSACLQGEIPSLLIQEKEEKARESAQFFKDIFPGRFYLEIQDHGIEDQKKVNKLLIPFAQKMGLPLVATNDAHYLNQEDSEAHDALLCIGTGKMIKDQNRMRYEGDQFYVKSAEEMMALFPENPEAIKNTLKIAEECSYTFEEGKYHLPEFPVPEDSTINTYLEKIASHGLELRFIEAAKADKAFSEEKKKKYMERLMWELDTIGKMGFPGYFLITWDFIKHAREKGIPVGPGRGSAAGSMVSYALKITELDPIEYGLIFERFLNPERISMPDIDIDFCMDRRGEVIAYVRDRYGGSSHVAQIITFGAMKAKAVVRDVARVMDIPYAEADKIAKLIPNDLNMTIALALEREPRLKKLEKENEEIEKLLSIAKSLEGTTRHASTHAAGVVISPRPLTDFMPLFKQSGEGQDVTTQYQMKDIEKLGLLKMDFLGLRTLTVINNAVNQIRAKSDGNFTIESIALDDKKTFDLLAKARTLGVFQLESSGMRDLIRKMKPTSFHDIVALVALFRPGPINSGMADQYVRRKHGHEEVKWEFPELKQILGETYGVIVYQEQVMHIANELAGFSLGQADSLRKAMGKKNKNIMDEIGEQFLAGAGRKKHNKNKIEKLWAQLQKFAEYGFNKSHSVCYALVAYQTAYLKAHHPAEYMASLITSEMDNTDKVLKYMQECREMKIKVLPPDVNESMRDFTVTDEGIRFGLAAVKGVGTGAVDAIITARNNNGAFKSVLNFAESVNSHALNKRVAEALVKCGAFDSTGHNRASLFAVIEETLSAAQKTQRDRDIGQESIFTAMGGEESSGVAVKIIDRPEWGEREKLAYEKEALGFYISGHPLSEYTRDLKLFATCQAANLEKARSSGEARFGGVIISRRIQTTKKGKTMAYLIIEDLTGSIEVLLWPKLYKKSVELIESDEPIFIKGKVEIDEEKGTSKVIADDIMTFEDARERFTNCVHVRMSTPGLEEETLMELKEIFEKRRGKCPAILHFMVPGKGELVMVASSSPVKAEESLIEEVENLLGAESVSFE
ncbi:DNA polymerase III alpha subunit [hydrothermal vent metagenome]|uniref:DNA polymerase III subunit alpha n=1 Tax=hydrothermal vent metagenome TaxID=652676 RepID=A0A3B1CC17_9ZZZZ